MHVAADVVSCGMDPWLIAQIVIIPLFSALVGWGTNRLAIRMLFFPRRAVHIGGMRLQGLIPRRHQEIASRTAEIVERELLDTRAIRQECVRMDLSPYIERYANHLVQEDLRARAGRIPFLTTIIGQLGWGRIESFIAKEMKHESRILLENVAEDIEQHIDVRAIVEQRMVAFDLRRLEKIIYKLAGKEFRMIEWLGAILGLLIGIMQLLVLWAMGSLG